MPKKKGHKNTSNRDFTINDSANAPKPITRIKKVNTVEKVPDTWDDIGIDEFDVIEETAPDGSKKLVYKKKRSQCSLKSEDIDNQQGVVYPEIVWYLISQFINPEDVGYFACINKTTYAITKCGSFWRGLYSRFCENNRKLPETLIIGKNFRVYGLRQRVIRALYHTYDVFINKVSQQTIYDSHPHNLVKCRCVNVWFCKGTNYWTVFFKLKKSQLFKRVETVDVIEELGRIDANPEENTQVLKVTCQNFFNIPPLIGMTLCSVTLVLSHGLRHHRLHLGFSTSSHNISRAIVPDYTVVLDSVVRMDIFDWWHPKYPHFDNKLPCNINLETDEPLPALKRSFSKTDLDL